MHPAKYLNKVSGKSHTSLEGSLQGWDESEPQKNKKEYKHE